MASAETLEWAIPSDTGEAQRVQEEIVAKIEAYGFSARDVFGLRLAMEEALMNAIRHGNGGDRSKQVRVWYEYVDGCASVRVEDEGPGFDPSDVPDPTLDENLERPGGRGIMLMRNFLDEIRYEGRGNVVFMKKCRTAETD
ncbi:MAG: ATP-binding protein [Planctomycetota bacterium]